MTERDARAPRSPTAASPWRAARDRARERELKRDAVILAAARAFRERGYHNTSLDDLAARLNVTKPTIYHYVENKEQILFECFRTGLDRIRAGFATAGHSGAGRERLAAVVRSYAEAVASEFGWCMVRAEDQDLSPAMSRRIKALKSEIDQGLRQLVAAGIADGSIRSDCDPKMTAFALAGALNWIAHWHREGESLTPVGIADRFLDLFENGLRPRS